MSSALSHLRSAGAGAVASLPAPVRNLASGLLGSLDQLPSVGGELDVLVAEVQAKRLSVQALQSELAALDQQLELRERSLAPVRAWSEQAGRLRTSLAVLLAGSAPGDPRSRDQGPCAPPDDAGRVERTTITTTGGTRS